MHWAQLKRPGVLAALFALVVLGGWWAFFRSDSASSASPTTVKQLATVTSGPMSETVSADGTVAAAQTADLSFSAAGTVTAVNVKAGDAVTAGQVLATIDSAELQSNVSAAESTVAKAAASLADDQSSGASADQLSADEASVTSANDALTSVQSALAGASMIATFDGTVASVNITSGEQLAGSGTGGTSATGSGSGSGRSSGTLGASANEGVGAGGGTGASSSSSSNSSSAATPQIEVVSKGRYTVELAVDSTDVDQVAAGQSATVTVSTAGSTTRGFGGGGFPGFGGLGAGRFGGGATSAGGARTGANAGGGNAGSGGATTGSPAASATGAVTDVSKVATASSGVATYPVTISFDAASADFNVGTTVTGAITTNERSNVIQVPARAVTTSNGTSTVVVATVGTRKGATETRTVKTGLTADGMVEITDGLKAGEKVIVTIPSFGRLSTSTGSRGGTGNFPAGGFGRLGGSGSG